MAHRTKSAVLATRPVSTVLVALLALGLAACASGEEQTADAGADVGGPCPAGEVICDGICVDTNRDPSHCGFCGFACAPGQTCRRGGCSDDCLESETLCDGECVYVDNDPDHCGQCGRPCGEEQSCAGGRCVCPDGLAQCGLDCADLSTDKRHCGECGRACKIGESCQAGLCVPICAGDAQPCGGTCVDTQVSSEHCGRCDHACDRTQACRGGECVCADGRELCGGACVDTDTNRQHCGRCDHPCPEGANCQAGLCECPRGFSECDGRCVDTLRDPRYCGDCETDCGDELCVDGNCAAGCPAGQELCDDGCVDTGVDELHCGDCEVTCRADQECLEGECDCPADLQECAGVCVDTQTSDTHCGGCDAPCDPGRTCTGGVCGCGDQIECDGACVDPKTDERHCGHCDHACTDRERCAGGDCRCTEDYTRCGGECVDTDTDPRHCGRCDDPCEEGLLCSGGECQAGCEAPNLLCDGICIDPSSDRDHCGGCDHPCADHERCAGSCTCVNDFYEPSDTPEQAVLLPVGASGLNPHLSDLRLCGEDLDLYVLSVPSPGAAVEVYLDADCLDEVLPRLALLDAGEVEVVAEEADGTGPCPILYADGLDAGYYYLEVRSTAGEGAYDLLVFLDDLSEVEPNEDPDSADGPFSADVDVDAHIADGFDFDTFEIFVPRRSLLTLETTDGADSCATDTVLWLDDDAGNPVDEDDDGGVGLCSKLEIEIGRGYYDVTVFGYDLETSGDYTLEVRFDYSWEAEPNAEIGEGPFEGAFGAEGVVFPSYDTDRYDLVLLAPATLRAEVTGNRLGCVLDSVLQLWSTDDDVLLGEDDDYDFRDELLNQRGLGACSRIDPASGDGPDQSWAVDLPAGTYTLVVSGWSDRMGAYNLEVDLVTEGE